MNFDSPLCPKSYNY